MGLQRLACCFCHVYCEAVSTSARYAVNIIMRLWALWARSTAGAIAVTPPVACATCSAWLSAQAHDMLPELWSDYGS